MMNIVFKSILREEIASFIEVVKLSVVDHKAYQRTLFDFDSFLCAENFVEKRLDAAHIECWLDGLDVHLLTKKSKLSHLRRFSAYLATLGIPATLPELPRSATDYTPYVFTEDEMTLIFDMADDLVAIRYSLKIKSFGGISDVTSDFIRLRFKTWRGAIINVG